MSVLNSDCYAVINYLKSLNINVPSDWAAKCVEDCRTLNPIASSLQLNKAVFDQWLLVNLRELKMGSLPTDVRTHNVTVLNGIYAVQVESMVDSSKSSFSELRRIRQQSDENLEIAENAVDAGPKTTSKSSRCLTFLLCDGIQEIQAMEYQFISSFKLNQLDFLPGFKMLVKGPVVCRKGMLLLEEKNVKIYGGKVESLCETNNLESLLLKRLNLNANNSNITKISSCGQIANVDNNVNVDVFKPSSKFTNICKKNTVPMSKSSSNIKSVADNNVVPQTNHIRLNIAHESRTLGPGKKGLEKMDDEQQCSKKRKKQNTQSSYEQIYINKNSDRSQCSVSGPPLKNLKNYFRTENYNSDNTPQEVITLDDDFYSGDLNFEDFPEIDADMGMIPDAPVTKSTSATQEITLENYPESVSDILDSSIKGTGSPSNATSSATDQACTSVSVSSYPFVYLKQIYELPQVESRNFTVKAIILTLKSKISIKNDEFALLASISDGSLVADVNFSSDVLEEILGFSPCEITSMLNDKAKNSAVQERIKDIFSSAQQKLLSMNCLMGIRFSNGISTPCVFSVEEVEAKHLNALKHRMSFI